MEKEEIQREILKRFTSVRENQPPADYIREALLRFAELAAEILAKKDQ